MRDVAIDYFTEDNCSGEMICTLSLESNEPTGQGDAVRDWEILDAHHVRLRAERSAKAGDRTYTITVTCRDRAGNASSETVKVSALGSRR